MHDEAPDPTEEEMRAAFEEQMRHVDVVDVILQTVATLVNLGARRLGLIPEPGEDPAQVRDIAQAQLAIEGARALAPLCPEDHQESIRQALSQLQLAYAREAQAGPGAPGAGPTPDPGPAPGPDAPADPPPPPAPSKLWTPPGS